MKMAKQLGYPKEIYEKLYALGVGLKGQDWLDIGTGTGEIPCALAHHGANITGIDKSEKTIKEAIRIAKEKELNIVYKISLAEKTDFPDDSFDVITAFQLPFYLDEIIPEVKRLIRNNGLFVRTIMSFSLKKPTTYPPELIKHLKRLELVEDYPFTFEGFSSAECHPLIKNWDDEYTCVDNSETPIPVDRQVKIIIYRVSK